MAGLTPKAQAWKNLGTVQKFNQHEVHVYYREAIGLTPGSNSLPLIVFLHGFPTCSYDWAKVIEQFTTHPVLAFDFLGFGISDKPKEYDYTLVGHADLTLELIEKYNQPRRPVFFVGHDMGTSVFAEIIARELYDGKPLGIQITGGLIFNGNMVMDKASLVLGQTLLRSPIGFIFSALQTKQLFKWQFARAVTPLPSMDAEWLDMDDQWNFLNYKNGSSLTHKTIQYTFERVTNAERLHGAIKDSKVPISFAWGLDDPVATAKLQFTAWKQLRPSAPCYELTGLGHYPQMEDPTRFAQLLLEILQKL